MFFKKYLVKTLLQQVGCGDSSEHQERLVPYPFSTMEDWKMKYLLRKRNGMIEMNIFY